MKILGIIPARYASTRFPGKPLILIEGKPMIQCVYERVQNIKIFSEIVVATDDHRIRDCVQNFGGKVIMTHSDHRSGTDRCGEVLKKLQSIGENFDVIVNIQGDEPYVEASQIEELVACFSDVHVQIATLKKEIVSEEELFSPNVVKVVCKKNGDAIYFSRLPIPYLRNQEQKNWINRQKYFKHIGIYAYTSVTLQNIIQLPQSELEYSESLEQLRWIENNYAIKTQETFIENVAIDTPEDLLKLKNR